MKQGTRSVLFLALLSNTVHFASAITLFTTSSNYSFTTVDVPGMTNPVATGVNDLGEIVGYGTSSGNQQVGFIDDAGMFTTLSLPGSNGTMANGLNDKGQVVGTYSDSTGTHGFEYSGGSYTSIDVPNSFPGTTKVVGINNSGQIAGNASLPQPPFGYSPAGFIDTAGTFQLEMQGSTPSEVYLTGINNSGQVVGYGGGGRGPGGAIFATASSLNLYAGFAQFNAINDSGQIVANNFYLISSPIPTSESAPFLGSTTTGFTNVYPGGASILGINDAGVLVGDFVDSSGVQHAFEATPVPEPPSFALLACAVLALGFRVWRGQQRATPSRSKAVG